MALNRFKRNNTFGSLTFHRRGASTAGRVGNDGRAKVHFHNNPRNLAAWFEKLNDACRRSSSEVNCSQKRKYSDAFVHDDNIPPNPPLNIAIHIVGSRGDVQPFIRIAQMLMKPPYNHRVRICTHPVFQDFVESNGVEFFSIGGDPEALMAYMVKNPGLLPSRESVKAGDIGKRRKEMAEIMTGVWRSCIEAGNGLGAPTRAAEVVSADDIFIADAIIANPPSMAHIHCAEKLGIPLHIVFTMPWSPTRSFHHPLASMEYGEVDTRTANYLSFMMMELLTWQGLGDLINKFRVQTLKLDPISPLWGFHLLPRLRVPFTYLWSKSLIPRPSDWDKHINITGFSFLPQADKYTPPPDLIAFLESGPPPVYIGFGSIVVSDPQALTKLIFEAVQKAKVRAIVSKGWGGVGVGSVPDNVYLIGNCPHDWLFQRVSAVVHHGGAGTTAAGIASGRPTVIVPFFGDQQFWGDMIARAGAGPTPIPFKQMTADSLANSIAFALKPEVQVAVRKMADQIANEDGAADTVKIIQDSFFSTDNLRCDLCPERLAVWRHKKSGLHLSNFAVACLADSYLLNGDECKLLRRRHWYVDEGAEHPLIGAIAAVSGTFTAIGTAASDYKHALKTPPPQRRRVSFLEAEKEIEANQEPDLTRGQDESSDEDRRNILTLTRTHLEVLAVKTARKSMRGVDCISEQEKARFSTERRKREHESRTRSVASHRARATGRFLLDVTNASLKAPVALFYNIANGSHNATYYGFNTVEVRRRDDITGFGSGCKVAGQEFALGWYDALSGLVRRPYNGAKKEGAKGFGIGVAGALRSLPYNALAALFGLLGYSLKGLEKEFSKRHMTQLEAELLLIRFRQAINDYGKASQDEKDEVIRRWKSLRK